MTNEITPGSSVDLIFESDYHRSSFRVLNALVYEVTDRKIILSQTSPPLTPGHVRQAVIVTYCTREAGQAERFGFTTRITGLMDDYQMASRSTAAAIVLERKTEPEQMNIRLHFRIQPKSDSGMALYDRGNKLNLIDISVGGARFSRDTVEELHPGDRMPLQLHIDDRIVDIDAGVVRSWIAIPAGRTKKSQFVAVRFSPRTTELEQILSNKIMAIERQRLAEGKLYK